MVSAEMVADLMGENSGEAYIDLVTFRAEGEDTGYLALNTEDVVSRGRTYHAADMTYRPMRKSGDELSNATLTFSNVSRDLIADIRQGFERPTVEVKLIAASRPDRVDEKSGEVEDKRATCALHSTTAEIGTTNIFEK